MNIKNVNNVIKISSLRFICLLLVLVLVCSLCPLSGGRKLASPFPVKGVHACLHSPDGVRKKLFNAQI